VIVPSLAPYYVALDTSALSNLLNAEDDLIPRFIEAARRKNAIIGFSSTVLFEITSDRDLDAVVRRLEALQRLQRDLGPNLGLSLGLNDLLQAEARGWLRAPVVHDADWSGLAQANHADLRKFTADAAESYDFMSKKKQELFGLDRGLHGYLLEKQGGEFDPDQLFARIVGAGPPDADEMIIEWAVKFSNGVWSPQRIVAEPMRFKATHAISHLVWRLQLANCADRQKATPEQAQLFGRWRTQRKGFGEGVWYDSYIAGEAAYMDLLVSDDENQRWRCDFLRQRGLLSFRTMSLDEFIA
jgi:hypothetical protein